jgi:AcrR family transcriptional regulator
VVEPVKARQYQSQVRRDRAQQTRRDILGAARQLFPARGYAATTVAQIAATAGVNPDTVYASVGAKPVLFGLLLETAISGADEAVPAEEREYVRRIQAATSAGERIDLYAGAVCAILGRLSPLMLVLRDAAGQVPELATLRETISHRRAANMLRYAQDLASTGELRPGLDQREVADTIWATSSAELYQLFIGDRGWTPQRYERWLAATWRRLFLPSSD